MNWIHATQKRNQMWALVNMVQSFWITQRWTTCRQSGEYQLHSKELVCYLVKPQERKTWLLTSRLLSHAPLGGQMQLPATARPLGLTESFRKGQSRSTTVAEWWLSLPAAGTRTCGWASEVTHCPPPAFI